GRLAAGEVAQLLDELQQPDRRVEGAVRGRRDAVHADRHAAGIGDLRGHLGARQDAALPRLRALTELELDHLDLRVQGIALETLGIETAFLVAAAEVARADLPDQVAAVLAVVDGDRTLAGIVVETAAPGAGIEGADGIGRERAEAHGRDVEDAGRVRRRPIRIHQHTATRRTDSHWTILR